jgi:putative membrane protein
MNASLDAPDWFRWQLDLPLVLMVAVCALLYSWFLFWQYQYSPYRQRLHLWRPILFLSGLIGLICLYCGPLQAMGNPYLFSARMLQHILLIYAIPCLLLAGIPEWSLLASYDRYPVFYQYLKGLSQPLSACLLFNGVFSAWHLPMLYELSLKHPAFHYLQIITLLATALLMWLPLINPLRSLQSPLPRQIFYVVQHMIAQVPLFAILTLSGYALYPTHALSPRVLLSAAYGDQQIGGWMLKILSTFIFSAIFIELLLRWHRNERLRDQIENATAYENHRLAQQSPQRFG